MRQAPRQWRISNRKTAGPESLVARANRQVKSSSLQSPIAYFCTFHGSGGRGYLRSRWVPVHLRHVELRRYNNAAAQSNYKRNDRKTISRRFFRADRSSCFLKRSFLCLTDSVDVWAKRNAGKSTLRNGFRNTITLIIEAFSAPLMASFASLVPFMVTPNTHCRKANLHNGFPQRPVKHPNKKTLTVVRIKPGSFMLWGGRLCDFSIPTRSNKLRFSI